MANARRQVRRRALERRSLGKVERRQDDGSDGSGDTVVVGGVTFTGPFTITVTSTRDAGSATITSTSLRSSTSSSSPRTSRTTTARSTAPPTSSSSSPTVAPTTDNPSASPSPLSSGALGNNSALSSGDIAGITIGIIMLVALPLLIFLFRRKLRQTLKSDLRKRWTFPARFRSQPADNAGFDVIQPFPSTMVSPPPVARERPAYTYEPEKGGYMYSNPPYGNSSSSRTKRLTVEIPDDPAHNVITVPASAYVGTPASAVPSTPYSGSNSTSGIMYSPGTRNNRSTYRATVHYTFIPTFPDELGIRYGETLRVLAEYDDGWALCVKPDGEQGMVPLECLVMSINGGAFPSLSQSPSKASSFDGEKRGSTRASSLGPNAQAFKDYRTNLA